MKKYVMPLMLACLTITTSLPKKEKTKKTTPHKKAEKKSPLAYRKHPDAKNLLFKQHMTIQELEENKSHVLLAFDLNDVLFHKHFSNLFGTAQQMIKKEGFIFTLKTLFKANRINRERTIINKDNHKENLSWAEVLHSHNNANDPLQPYVEYMYKTAANVNALCPCMTNLIYTLHNVNHHPHFLSNIGKDILSRMIEHLKRQTPDPTEISSPAYNYILKFLQDSSHNYNPTPQNNWITKSHDSAYKSFLRKNPGKKFSILIDNKKENCIRAIENGFDAAIIYKSCDNLKHLLFDILHLKK